MSSLPCFKGSNEAAVRRPSAAPFHARGVPSSGTAIRGPQLGQA